jgi:hypothetical protein
MKFNKILKAFFIVTGKMLIFVLCVAGILFLILNFPVFFIKVENFIKFLAPYILGVFLIIIVFAWITDEYGKL